MEHIRNNTKASRFKHEPANVPATWIIAPSDLIIFSKKQLNKRFIISFDIHKTFLNID